MSEVSPPSTFKKYGSTPVSRDDALMLIDKSLKTKLEVEDAEAVGFNRALYEIETNWSTDDIRIREFHRKALGDVWEWAGQYRTREMSIGIDPIHISEQMRDLVENATVWKDFAVWKKSTDRDDSRYSVAARYHHRFVEIHPFVNGNGRTARFATNDYLESMSLPMSFDFDSEEQVDRYIEALRFMDREHAKPGSEADLVDVMKSSIVRD